MRKIAEAETMIKGVVDHWVHPINPNVMHHALHCTRSTIRVLSYQEHAFGPSAVASFINRHVMCLHTVILYQYSH